MWLCYCNCSYDFDKSQLFVTESDCFLLTYISHSLSLPLYQIRLSCSWRSSWTLLRLASCTWHFTVYPNIELCIHRVLSFTLRSLYSYWSVDCHLTWYAMESTTSRFFCLHATLNLLKDELWLLVKQNMNLCNAKKYLFQQMID